MGKGNVNSFHNVAVKRCDALMNQDQSIHDESKESKNKGNFRELVSTLADQNEVVRNSIRIAPENCQWICGDIQKEITSYFAKVMSSLKYIIEVTNYNLMSNEYFILLNR